MPPTSGEKMTSSPVRLRSPGTPALMRATPTTTLTTTEEPKHSTSPPPMLRRTAPTSRPSGRYAVGLRPSPDAGTSIRRALHLRRSVKQDPAVPLDRPHSFRDDLHILQTPFKRAANAAHNGGGDERPRRAGSVTPPRLGLSNEYRRHVTPCSALPCWPKLGLKGQIRWS